MRRRFQAAFGVPAKQPENKKKPRQTVCTVPRFAFHTALTAAHTAAAAFGGFFFRLAVDYRQLVFFRLVGRFAVQVNFDFVVLLAHVFFLSVGLQKYFERA